MSYKASPQIRFFFFVSASILWAGLFLTGLEKVHWLLFIPPSFFLFAAVTGICPGLIISNLIFRKRGGDSP